MGGAVANGLITSHDIKNDTIRSVDVQNGTLGLRDMNAFTQAKIDQRGPRGPRGVQGEPGLSDLTVDGPYTSTWKGDSGASLQEAVVSCDPGEAAVGGGFSVMGGADDNTPDAAIGKDIQVIASYPFTDNYVAVNKRGSFVANEWVVKGYNNGTTDQTVRPWVVCATVAPSQAAQQ